MSFKDHVPPTLHNAAGTIIASLVVAAAGASYLWLRGTGSVSIPVWLIVLELVATLGVFTWLTLRLRRYARANVLVLRSATWGASDKTTDVRDVLRSKIRDNTLTVRATNRVLGSDPCYGIGKYIKVEYSYRGKQASHTVPEGETLSIP
jgi:Domain of unknown function (DUF3395)